MLQTDSATLFINVRSAIHLISAQTFGKQDPYLQFTLNVDDKDTFQKTFVHNDAGENATWNQSFSVPLNGEPDLYIEVFDKESSVDEIIGFCAIPISQIVNAPGANLNGLFDLFDIKRNHAGKVNLQFATQGFANSEVADPNTEPIQGESYVNDNHAVRIKSLRNKEIAADVGAGLFGAGLMAGAGFLAKQLYDKQQAQLAEQVEAEE